MAQGSWLMAQLAENNINKPQIKHQKEIHSCFDIDIGTILVKLHSCFQVDIGLIFKILKVLLHGSSSFFRARLFQ